MKLTNPNRKYILLMSAIVWSLWLTSEVNTGKQAAKLATQPLRDTHESLHSVLWVQTSAEYRVSAEHAYRLAREKLELGLRKKNWTAALEQTGKFSKLKPALILDIDETVLDNSRFAGQLVRNRGSYDPALWSRWVEMSSADAVPGVTAFAQYASKKGVEIFYITNRKVSQEASTRKNLSQLGLPIKDDPDSVLSRDEKTGWGNDKSTRRAFVAQSYRILLLIGDDLGDFLSLDKPTPEQRVQLAMRYPEYWGAKWILLPNPVHGSWEASLYAYNNELNDEQVLATKMRHVRGIEKQ